METDKGHDFPNLLIKPEAATLKMETDTVTRFTWALNKTALFGGSDSNSLWVEGVID